MRCGWSWNFQICCIHYLIIVHICFCHSMSSIMYPILGSDALIIINLILFFLFLLNFYSPRMIFLKFPPRPSIVPASLILHVAHFSHHHHHHSLHRPSLNPVELVFPPSLPSVLQSTCDTLRSHSDSLGFTPNMLPRHPTLGNFEEFACWQHKVGVGGTSGDLTANCEIMYVFNRKRLSI